MFMRRLAGCRSAPRPPYGRYRAGFTLIELLVVIVIIGCMLSLAVFSMGSSGGGRELRGETERLASVIALLLEEATLDNREYGLQLRNDGYRVLAYDDTNGLWAPAPQTVDYRLPSWIRLDLQLEGAALKLPQVASQVDEDDEMPANAKLQPQLLLLSSGELSPFHLQLSDRRPAGQVYELVSDGFSLPQATAIQGRK
ncbi:MAG: type II secretion system minor pseudopilin GspH [Pseudomonas sp.]|nr:type II secretion system minor pseudopilin GspH [Pseudomonas sp.]